MEKNAQGEWVYDIPSDYQALLSKLSQRLGSASLSVMIPLGRSLQKFSAGKDFLEFPRIVTAFDQHSSTQNDFLVRDRLYLAFNEKAEQLEVISFNEEMARMEFQIVPSYKPSSSRLKAAYVDREICLKCHQGANAIFAERPWDESNAGTLGALRDVHDLEEYDFKKEYLGLRLQQQDEAFYDDDPVKESFLFDQSTDRASVLFQPWQNLWSICQDNLCKKAVSALFLGKELGLGARWHSQTRKRFEEGARVLFQKLDQGVLTEFDSDILNFNPLDEHLLPSEKKKIADAFLTSPAYSEQEHSREFYRKNRVKRAKFVMSNNALRAHDFSPVKRREKELIAIRWIDDKINWSLLPREDDATTKELRRNLRFRFEMPAPGQEQSELLSGRLGMEATKLLPPRLRKELKQLCAGDSSCRPLLIELNSVETFSTNFRPLLLINQILGHEKQATAFDPVLYFASTRLESGTREENVLKHGTLEVSQVYCMGCHSVDTPDSGPLFLQGVLSLEDIDAQLRQAICDRLTHSDPDLRMPPVDSLSHKKLVKRPEERKKLLREFSCEQ